MAGSRIRRLAVVFELARVRLVRRSGRFVLAALGVAAGAAVLAGVLGTSVAAQDASIARAVAQIPADQRAVRAYWSGIPVQEPGGFSGLDAIAQRGLESILGRAPFRTVLFREGNLGGAFIDLAAIDGLERWVTLRSGRLPHDCRSGSCEVIQVAGAGHFPARFALVGAGSLTSSLPLGGLLSQNSTSSILSSAARYHEPDQPPFLLGGDVGALARDVGLADQDRTYSWVVPMAGLHPWSVGRFEHSIAQAQSVLDSSGQLFTVTAPTEQIDAAAATARVSARRLLVLGGSVAALLLVFSVLAAASLRRDSEAARRQLGWRGASRLQLGLLSGVETAFVAVAGTVVGWAAGVGLAALAAGRLGAPVGGVLRHSVLSGAGLAVAAGLAAAAALVLFGALWAPVVRIGERALTLADVAGLGALVALVVGVARGATNADSLAAHGGTGVFLLLLPGLVSLVLAVAAARLLAPVLRALERAGRRAPVAARLAALSLARNPGRATSAVVFLVVSLGFALFAVTYRATLTRGEQDEAAFAAPADVLLSEDLTKLVPVLEAGSPAAYARLGRATQVVRLNGDVPNVAPSLTLLGIPSGAIPALGGWRSDFSNASLGDLAARLRPTGPVALRGLRVGSRLVVPATLRGDALKLTGAIETRRGDVVRVPLGRLDPGKTELAVSLPAAARDGLLFSLGFTVADVTHFGVANGGLGEQPFARGRLTLGGQFSRWLGVGGVRPDGRYLVTPDVDARVRSPQPTDGEPVPVIVPPKLAAAARGHLLPIDVGGQPLLTRVVGVATRFPSAGTDFVLADGPTVQTALDAGFPGAGVTNEIWLDGADPAVLARPPFGDLSALSRQAVEADLRSDPLARGVLLALGGTAAVALGLAVLGLLLALVADVKDEGAELLDLEGQGAGPAMLRRHLRLRMLLLSGFGLVGGIAAGAALGALVVDLIVVTANAGSPEPPLAVVVDWRLLGAGVGAYVVVALVAVALASRRGLGRLGALARHAQVTG